MTAQLPSVLFAILVAGFCVLGDVAAQDEGSPLKKLQSNYEAYLSEHTESLREWTKKEFLRIEKLSKSTGDLDLVIAVRDARVAYALGEKEAKPLEFAESLQVMVDTRPAIGKQIVALRDQHHTRLERIFESADRVYLTELAKLQTDLTKEGKIDEAKAALEEERRVKEARERLKLRGNVDPAAVRFRDSYYLCTDEKLTWEEANAKCKDMGGHLATVSDLAEDEFLVALCDREKAWLGASVERPGKWKWVNGEPFEFTRWHDRQPDNNKGRENYLAYNWVSWWNDVYGEEKYRYICEWSFPK